MLVAPMTDVCQVKAVSLLYHVNVGIATTITYTWTRRAVLRSESTRLTKRKLDENYRTRFLRSGTHNVVELITKVYTRYNVRGSSPQHSSRATFVIVIVVISSVEFVSCTSSRDRIVDQSKRKTQGVSVDVCPLSLPARCQYHVSLYTHSR